MKQWRISRMASLLMACLFTLSAYAQTQPDSSSAPQEAPVGDKRDTTEVMLKNKKIIIISDSEGKKIQILDVDGALDDDEVEIEDQEYEEPSYEEEEYDGKKSRSYRKRSEVGGLGFDFGVTNYFVGGQYGSNAAPASLTLREFRPGSHVALHFFPTRVSLIGRGAVNLKTALTLDWANYYFTENITLIEDQPQVTLDTTGILFSRNKLTSRYVQLPLLLNFNTAPGSDDGVSISVGGYAGLLWSAHTKQVSDENGRVKVRDDFNLNPFRYGLTARVDFKWFDFYLNYNLSEVFAENEGPSAQTFTAGINFLNF
jgi:hypothetical protein